MKKLFYSFIFAFVLFSQSGLSAEDYKTYRPSDSVRLGVSGGMGLINTTPGLLILPSISTVIAREGWIPEIVNPVSIEGQLGPMFAKGQTLWMYSAHLRWDFVKDELWTLFALGGVGGNFYDNTKFGSDFAFHPRFGVGAFYDMGAFLYRAELSPEAITFGLASPS